MASSIINSDDGSVSGTTGLKTTGGDDGVTVFQQNGTESMRITSNGRVGIGTSSPTTNLTVAPSGVANGIDITVDPSNANRSGRLFFSNSTAGQAIALRNDGGSFLISNGAATGSSSGTERMRITSDGEVYIAGTTDQGAYNLQCNGTGVWGQGAYVNGSDERMKQNITDLQDGLSVVTLLRPVTYQYREEFSKDQNTQTGFIAQELQAALDGKDYKDGIVPEGPEYLNVAYQNLIPILTKAIQELKAEVDELKALLPKE